MQEAPVPGRRRRVRHVPLRPPAHARGRAERRRIVAAARAGPSGSARRAPGVPEVGVAVRVAQEVGHGGRAQAPPEPALLPDAAGRARLRRRRWRRVGGRRHSLRVREAARAQVLRARHALRPPPPPPPPQIGREASPSAGRRPQGAQEAFLDLVRRDHTAPPQEAVSGGGGGGLGHLATVSPAEALLLPRGQQPGPLA